MCEEDQYLIPEEDVVDKSRAQEDVTSITDQHDVEDNQQSHELTDDSLVLEDGSPTSPVHELTDDSLILEDTSPTPPVQLLEDDDVPLTASPGRLFISLNEKRKKAARNLDEQECKGYEVDRHNCFENLLSIYKDESITKQNISLRFKNEDAAGDGVSREVYSVFWNSYVTTFCEGSSHYIFSVSAALSSYDYVVLGRILTHQYLLTSTFPVQLSEAAMQQAVVGTVTNECLISSFMLLLPENEREILQCALNAEESFPTYEMIEILSDYGVQKCPTKENVKEILIQVSTTELVAKPFLCLNKPQEGMGPFWKAVTSDEIGALYMLCSPTNTNVIPSLQLHGDGQQENKVFQWLVRYLRSKNQQCVSRFLRFCTGSDIVLPYSSIKVRMENMSALSMRPKAQTCFRVLVIPKNYPTQSRLRDNMDFYLSNPHLWDLTD